MTLYSYDHCPYCVKARMIFGIKGIPLNHRVLLNDDEKTPVAMVGKKVVPILEKEDGSFLPESMDIVRYCDSLPNYGAPRVGPSREDPSLKLWLRQTRQYNYALAMPRWVKMGLEEFATASAVTYFIENKYSSIGDFDDNLAISEDLKTMAERHLKILDGIIKEGPWFWGKKLSEDDFHVFAALRVLTTFKGLCFPEKLNTYSQRVSEISRVPLHWEKAIGVCND